MSVMHRRWVCHCSGRTFHDNNDKVSINLCQSLSWATFQIPCHSCHLCHSAKSNKYIYHLVMNTELPSHAWAMGGVYVLCCWGVTRIKVCAATVLALEGQCPGIKFQTKQFVHFGSRICSPKPKSRSSTDAILPSFVIKTYSLAVLGIQSSSSSMNESVLYQTIFPC